MLNQVNIIGNLGQDPELRYTQNQNAVATLSVATNERWTGADGQKQEHTEWHRVILWNQQAENASKYLKKGSKVFVGGKLRTRAWDDKDGIKRYTTEIIANTIQFLDSKEGGRGAQPPMPNDAPAQQQARPAQNANPPQGGMSAPGAPGLDDIPF